MGEAQRDITSWKGQPQFFFLDSEKVPILTRIDPQFLLLSLSHLAHVGVFDLQSTHVAFEASCLNLARVALCFLSLSRDDPLRFRDAMASRCPPAPSPLLSCRPRSRVRQTERLSPPKTKKIPVRYFQIFPNVWGNRKNASESFGLLQLKRIESVGRGEGADREGRAPAHERGILYTRKPWEVLNAKE